MSSDETHSGPSTASLESDLEQLACLLALASYDKHHVRVLVDRIALIGVREGLTDRQARQVADLALRHSASSRDSLALLRSIHPASATHYGEAFVLIIVGALGPVEDTLVDGIYSNTASGRIFEESNGEGTSSRTIRRMRRRNKLAVTVQAAAIRLLILLLSPPSTVEISGQSSTDDGETPLARLPASFLTLKARRMLDKCYGVFFHHLDYQMLRPSLCHLLVLVTRRRHVRRFRITKVLQLRRAAPDEPHLTLLLSTLSKYSGGHGSSHHRLDQKNSITRYPDSQWLHRVSIIWTGNSVELGDRGSRDGRSRKRGRYGGSHLDSEEVYTTLGRLSLPPMGASNSEPFSLLTTEAVTYKGLGYMFAHLRFPDHLVCALNHRMTEVALLARGLSQQSRSTVERITRWATSAAGEGMVLSASRSVRNDELPPRNRTSHRKSAALLFVMGDFIEKIGSCDAVLQNWISHLLEESRWNGLGADEQEAALRLLETFVPKDWTRFREAVFDPIFKLLQVCSARIAASLVDALRKLFENWTSNHNWTEISKTLAEGKQVPFGCAMLSPDVEYLTTIASAIEAAFEGVSEVLARHPSSLVMMESALSLFECVLVGPFIGLHRYSLPPQYPLILLLMSQQGAITTVSRSAGILKQVRDLHVEVEEGDLSGGEDHGSTYLPEPMKQFRSSFFCDESKDAYNDCSVFLTDLIWRSNAFGNVQDGGLETGIPLLFFELLSERCLERGADLEKIASISHSAALGPLMEMHANEVRDSAGVAVKGPVTGYALEQAKKRGFPSISSRRFRDNHLDWLSVRGAQGIQHFLHVTVSRLMDTYGSDYTTRDQSSMSHS